MNLVTKSPSEIGLCKWNFIGDVLSSVANHPDPSTALKHLFHSRLGQQCGSIGGLAVLLLPPRPRKPTFVSRSGTCSHGFQQHFTDEGPTCAKLCSRYLGKQAALSPSCQGEGPCLPASSQTAEQVTRSIAPPECPIHWADEFTHTHSHTHTHTFLGNFSDSLFEPN